MFHERPHRVRLNDKPKSELDQYDSHSVLPGSKFDEFLEERKEKAQLLADTQLPNGRFTVPIEAQRFLDMTAESVDFQEINRKTPLSYEEQLRKKKEQLDKARGIFHDNIKHLNEERERLLERKIHLTEFRRVLDKKPLTPPFVDDGLPQTLKTNWNHIGSRVPPDPSHYRLRHPEPVIEILTDVKTNVRKREALHQVKKNQFIEKREALKRPYHGDMSIETYEPWQLPNYYLCRQILLDEVNAALDHIFNEVPQPREKLELDLKRHVSQKAMQLIMEEFVLEVTSEMALLGAREFVYLSTLAANMSHQAVICQSSAAVIGNLNGRPMSDELYDKSVKMFYRLQRMREIQKPTLWNHDFRKSAVAEREMAPVAPVIQEGKQISEVQPDEIPEEEDDLRPLIDYTELVPCHLALRINIEREPDLVLKKNVKKLRDYHTLELRYWSKLKLKHTGISLLQPTGGYSFAVVSPNQKYLAAGTKRGDVIVFDIHHRLSGGNIKVVRHSPPERNQQKQASNNSIIHMAWSVDSDGVVTVNAAGTVGIYSVQHGPLPPQYDRSTKRKLTNIPAKTPLFLMASIDSGAFAMTKGPIANNPNLTTHGNQYEPVSAHYFPSFNILGGQSDICVTMATHEHFKFNIDKFFDTEDNTAVKSEAIKRSALQTPHAFTNLDLPVELFVEHKYPVICVGCLHNTGDMISVDKSGIVAKWSYKQDLYLDARNGYRPSGAWRIRMNKEQFEPDPSIPLMVRFNMDDYDVFEERDELRNDRKTSEEEIFRNNCRVPWLSRDDFSKSTTIYKPEKEYIKASGGAFHEVTRFKSNGLLVKYITRVYKSYKFHAESLLNCVMNRTNTRALAVVLYPTDPGKENQHLELCYINLVTMKAIDPRIIIQLSDKEVKEIRRFNHIPVSLSSVFNYTLSEYAILNIAGVISIYSMVSGQQVAKTVIMDSQGQQVVRTNEKSFKGCLIRQSLYQVSPLNQLLCVGNKYEFDWIMVKPGDLTAKVFVMDDSNTSSERKQFGNVLQNFDWIYREDRSLRTSHSNMYILTDDHVTAFCGDIVYDMVDRAVQLCRNVTYSKETIDEHEAINRQRCYECIELSSLRRDMGEVDMKHLESKKVPRKTPRTTRPTANQSKTNVDDFPKNQIDE